MKVYTTHLTINLLLLHVILTNVTTRNSNPDSSILDLLHVTTHLLMTPRTALKDLY